MEDTKKTNEIILNKQAGYILYQMKAGDQGVLFYLYTSNKNDIDQTAKVIVVNPRILWMNP